MENIKDYAQYGVAIFAMGVLGYVIKLFMGFMKNHIHESTQSNQKLADAIQQMLRFLEKRR